MAEANMDMTVNLVPPRSFAKLAAALSKAQKSISPPQKKHVVDFVDKNNRRVKYAYADLADCIEAIKEPFEANGLSVAHTLGYSGNLFGLTTFLFHESGEFLESWYPLPDPKKENIKPQEFGSSLTYARRYSLSAIAGFAAEEDDDGNAGADTGPAKGSSKAQSGGNAPQSSPSNQSKGATAKKKEPEKKPEITPHQAKLNDLLSLVAQYEIPAETMSKYIADLNEGAVIKAKDLTIDQLQSVINYINLMH